MKSRIFSRVFLVSMALLLSAAQARADGTEICDSRENLRLLRCTRTLIENENWIPSIQALETLRHAQDVSEVRAALAECKQLQHQDPADTDELEELAHDWLDSSPKALRILAVIDSFIDPTRACSEISAGLPAGFGLIAHSRSGVRQCTSTNLNQWLEQVGELGFGTGIALAPYVSRDTRIKREAFWGIFNRSRSHGDFPNRRFSAYETLSEEESLAFWSREPLLNYKLYEFVMNQGAQMEEADSDTVQLLERGQSESSAFGVGWFQTHGVEASIPFFPLRASRKQAAHTCRYLRDELVYWPEF